MLETDANFYLGSGAERGAGAQLVGVWCLSGSLLGWQARETGPRGSGRLWGRTESDMTEAT